MKNSRFFRVIFLLFLIGWLVLIYLPGLGGDFLVLDSPRVIGEATSTVQKFEGQIPPLESWRSNSGPIGRPLTIGSFMLEISTGYGSPENFRRTNLLIHLLNSLLVFCFFRLLIKITNVSVKPIVDGQWGWFLAFSAALIWASHPFHVNSVLYVVQRMASFSHLFTLAAMVFYLMGRHRQITGRPGGLFVLAAMLVWFPLSVAAKETGLLIPAYLLVIEWLILRWAGSRNCVIALQGMYLATSVLPGFMAVVWFAMHPNWILDGYSFRDFTLWERLLTQSRVLVSYLHSFFIPSLSSFGVFHDDVIVSRSIIDPVSTMLSLLIVAGLLVAAFLMRLQQPLLSFAIFFFFAAHALESTVFPLELRFDHRNYLAIAPMTLAILNILGRSLMSLFSRSQAQESSEVNRNTGRSNTRAVVTLVVVLVLGLSFQTLTLSNAWSSSVAFYFEQSRLKPQSARAAFHLAESLRSQSNSQISGDIKKARELADIAIAQFKRSRELDPANPNSYIGELLTLTTFGVPCSQDCLGELASVLRASRRTGTQLRHLQALVEHRNFQLLYGEAAVQALWEASLISPVFAKGTEAQILLKLAQISSKSGRHDDAIRYIDAAQRSDTNQQQLLLLEKSLLLANAGQREQALAVIKQVRAEMLTDALSQYADRITTHISQLPSK